eukprot:14848432-Heterocapsa_arctica.AAC.1
MGDKRIGGWVGCSRAHNSLGTLLQQPCPLQVGLKPSTLEQPRAQPRAAGRISGQEESIGDGVDHDAHDDVHDAHGVVHGAHDGGVHGAPGV